MHSLSTIRSLTYTDPDPVRWTSREVFVWLLRVGLRGTARTFRQANVTGSWLMDGMREREMIAIGIKNPMERHAVKCAVRELRECATATGLTEINTTLDGVIIKRYMRRISHDCKYSRITQI